MNRQTFHFIMCVNRERMARECAFYISRLYVPEGYDVEITTITDAKSMCEGYNRAIRMKPGDDVRTSDVPYRIYLHQDVYIMNRWFLHHLLAIFASDAQIGLVGMVGTKELDETGIMWAGQSVGMNLQPSDDPYEEEPVSDRISVEDMVSADGFLLATSADVPWREDLFDGFDFYDVSQCFEMRRRGYRVVVPLQTAPWCLHDDGKLLSMWNYNEYRKILLENYEKEWFHL
ncbi:MAG: glycosyltransferase family protein [Lachnospiraceae bacterium]|nr:glycosyltransferase family protein [Lachnospiraceae bacterium]